MEIKLIVRDSIINNKSEIDKDKLSRKEGN